jgi:superfamily I DNA/RNA helicase
MTIQIFSGGAGCGKTYHLIQALSEYLIRSPLLDNQKVLALTFMHGSRNRLEERLFLLEGLRRNFECSTIDSFAWRIVRRWQAMANHLGIVVPLASNYEQVCETAATLLEQDIVVKWVAASFPIVLLDEAQDMSSNRLRIIRSLAFRVEILAAADEFQCLDEQLRPNPACDWFSEAGSVEELTTPYRTNVTALLDAASAIRTGNAPVSINQFTIKLTPNAPLAGSWVSNALGWYGTNRSVAIITPTAGQFASRVIEWVEVNSTSHGNGPFAVQWEKTNTQIGDQFLDELNCPETISVFDAYITVRNCENFYLAGDVKHWLDVQRRVKGRNIVTRTEIELIVKQSISNQKRGQRNRGKRFRAMTIHGAKNREFDNVIVLWPAAVGGSDDQKRRLLYNAVTRAKLRCLVLVQAKVSLTHAPFV